MPETLPQPFLARLERIVPANAPEGVLKSFSARKTVFSRGHPFKSDTASMGAVYLRNALPYLRLFAPKEDEMIVQHALDRQSAMFDVAPVTLPFDNRGEGLEGWKKIRFDESIKHCRRILPTEEMDGFSLRTDQTCLTGG